MTTGRKVARVAMKNSCQQKDGDRRKDNTKKYPPAVGSACLHSATRLCLPFYACLGTEYGLFFSCKANFIVKIHFISKLLAGHSRYVFDFGLFSRLVLGMILVGGTGSEENDKS